MELIFILWPLWNGQQKMLSDNFNAILIAHLNILVDHPQQTHYYM